MDKKRAQVLKSTQRLRKGNLPHALLWHGDVEKCLEALPRSQTFDLVITSPPYNIGKPYESPIELRDYIEWQSCIIGKCLDRLKDTGSICWQVGNYVQTGATGKATSIMPLDFLFFEIFRSYGLKLRNRIIWHFGHGLHCKHRFSGRYEVVLWFTKSDNYYFDLDAVRIKPKYPGKKHFKGPRVGQYSSNPNGKNPEDLWEIEEEMLSAWESEVWQVPNVKSNHVEKTIHPCQFPIAVVDRFVLSMSPPDGTVFDPFAGVATTGVAATMNGRKFLGCEIDEQYINIGLERLKRAIQGDVQFRPFEKPIYDHMSSPLSKEPAR